MEMTKLQDTQQSIQELKSLAEALYSTPEGRLVEEFAKFERFREELNSLLSTVARYRIQLNAPEDEIIFGPKTLKTVEAIVEDYDKLYEIYEEHLYNIFAPMEHLYYDMLNKGDTESEQMRVTSIAEETKSQLKMLDEARQRLAQNEGPLKVDFTSIQNQDCISNELHAQVLDVFKECPCDDLGQILLEIYSENEPEFERVVGNVSSLVREISRRPDEISLRILRLNNERMRSDFLCCLSSVKLLKFIGFGVRTTTDIQAHLAQLKIKPDEEYWLYLHEPDMLALYDKWKLWFTRLNDISASLEGFLANFKRLKRSNLEPRVAISKSLPNLSH